MRSQLKTVREHGKKSINAFLWLPLNFLDIKLSLQWYFGMNYNDSEILFIDSEDWKTQAVMAIQTINLGTGVDMVLLISSFLEVWRGSTCVTRYTGLPVLILNLELIHAGEVEGREGDLVRTDDYWQEWHFPKFVDALQKWTERNPIPVRSSERTHESPS